MLGVYREQIVGAAPAFPASKEDRITASLLPPMIAVVTDLPQTAWPLTATVSPDLRFEKACALKSASGSVPADAHGHGCREAGHDVRTRSEAHFLSL
jgi:hypothetical protein